MNIFIETPRKLKNVARVRNWSCLILLTVMNLSLCFSCSCAEEEGFDNGRALVELTILANRCKKQFPCAIDQSRQLARKTIFHTAGQLARTVN